MTLEYICNDEIVYFAGYKIISGNLAGAMGDSTPSVTFGLPLLLSAVVTIVVFIIKRNKL